MPACRPRRFAVLETAGDAATCGLIFPVFVKPLAEGTGKGCERASKVYGHAALAEAARNIRARFGQPALAEAFLPGREFTIGIVGEGSSARVIGVMEISLVEAADDAIYSFESKELCESRVIYMLAHDAEAQAAGASALRSLPAAGLPGCGAAGFPQRRGRGSALPGGKHGSRAASNAIPICRCWPRKPACPSMLSLMRLSGRRRPGGASALAARAA